MTKLEVDALRDNITVVVTAPETANAVDDGRGYKDIDPSHAWEEWQVVRVQLQ